MDALLIPAQNVTYTQDTIGLHNLGKAITVAIVEVQHEATCHCDLVGY